MLGNPQQKKRFNDVNFNEHYSQSFSPFNMYNDPKDINANKFTQSFTPNLQTAATPSSSGAMSPSQHATYEHANRRNLVSMKDSMFAN
jgi:hypothetical protein